MPGLRSVATEGRNPKRPRRGAASASCWRAARALARRSRGPARERRRCPSLTVPEATVPPSVLVAGDHPASLVSASSGIDPAGRLATSLVLNESQFAPMARLRHRAASLSQSPQASERRRSPPATACWLVGEADHGPPHGPPSSWGLPSPVSCTSRVWTSRNSPWASMLVPAHRPGPVVAAAQTRSSPSVSRPRERPTGEETFSWCTFPSELRRASYQPPGHPLWPCGRRCVTASRETRRPSP